MQPHQKTDQPASNEHLIPGGRGYGSGSSSTTSTSSSSTGSTTTTTAGPPAPTWQQSCNAALAIVTAHRFGLWRLGPHTLSTSLNVHLPFAGRDILIHATVNITDFETVTRTRFEPGWSPSEVLADTMRNVGYHLTAEFGGAAAPTNPHWYRTTGIWRTSAIDGEPYAFATEYNGPGNALREERWRAVQAAVNRVFHVAVSPAGTIVV